MPEKFIDKVKLSNPNIFSAIDILQMILNLLYNPISIKHNWKHKLTLHSLIISQLFFVITFFGVCNIRVLDFSHWFKRFPRHPSIQTMLSCSYNQDVSVRMLPHNLKKTQLLRLAIQVSVCQKIIKIDLHKECQICLLWSWIDLSIYFT